VHYTHFLVLTTISALLSCIPKPCFIAKHWSKMNLNLRLIIVFHIRWLPISHSSSAGGFLCFSVPVTKFYTTQIFLMHHTNLSTSIQTTWTHIFASRNTSHVVQADRTQNNNNNNNNNNNDLRLVRKIAKSDL